MSRTPTITDLRPALQTDKHDLDEEHIRHPEIIFQCGQGLAKATELFERAKNNVDLVLARLDKQYREAFNERGEKFSETSLARAIDLDAQMQHARDDVIVAKLIMANWSALLEGFRTKSSSLKKLSELYVANYFQTESSKVGHAHVRDAIADKVREETGKVRRTQRVQRDES